MKKVLLRVSECVTVDMSAKHLESLGYKNLWGDFRPESPNAVVGDRNGEISWDTDLDFLFNDGYEEIFITTTKQSNEHPHQESLTKWLTDVSQKIWARYEGGYWSDISPQHLICSGACGLKIHVGHTSPKRKIMIGDFEIDAPEVAGLVYGDAYFLTNTEGLALYAAMTWVNNRYDNALLKRGLVHLNKEAAIAHAKALIKVSGGCVDE